MRGPWESATSELYRDGGYVLEHEGRTLGGAELADYWADLAGRYPIVSIEDGMAEEDWTGWRTLTERLGAGWASAWRGKRRCRAKGTGVGGGSRKGARVMREGPGAA